MVVSAALQGLLLSARISNHSTHRHQGPLTIPTKLFQVMAANREEIVSIFQYWRMANRRLDVDVNEIIIRPTAGAQ